VISVEQTFYKTFPRLAAGPARALSLPVVSLLRRVVCEERINAEVRALDGLAGLEFVRAALARFNFSYRVAPTDLAHLPSEGRVLIVANHPLGALDALALLDLVGSLRPDVRIIGNRLLERLDGLGELLLRCEVFGARQGGVALRSVYRALEDERAVIVFPAGEVSRIGPTGIRDGAWAPGFVRFARRCGAAVVPVHIAAANSPAFYGASMLARPLGTLMLPRELLGAENSRITVTLGAPVPAHALGEAAGSPEHVAAAMRKHVYRLARRQPPLFVTGNTIAHPEPPLQVRAALRAGQLLGETSDGKRIVLVDGQAGPVLREIGRLRELAFRRVGEGTGLARDLDRFDRDYRHIVLWDEAACEIVGEAASLLGRRGMAGLYTATLFDYAASADGFLGETVELGRSFVHPRYWGTRSLDYLWQGIGAYLRAHPQVRYLLGPVSLSAELPEPARWWIIEAHRHYFAAGAGWARARNPAQAPAGLRAQILSDLDGLDSREGLALVRQRVAAAGGQYPVLYRQYVELCEPDGVVFADFGVDPAFGHCVDGLIRLDLSRLRPGKRARYLGAASASHASDMSLSSAPANVLISG
jgi:putative hemolysin